MTTDQADALLAHLSGYPGMVVAFSGGTDSALLLAAAVRALGPEQVLAATVVSPSLASGELAAAENFAVELGVRHVAVAGAEVERAGYRANARDRCAHCKTELMEVLLPVAARHLGPTAVVATGTNSNDVVDPNRPGIAAAAHLGAQTPLATVGLSKQQIRDISRDWGLRTWDKPQAACLASRVAYGVPVTEAGLKRVDRAETRLRALFASHAIGVRNLRVRDLGDDRARVEVDAELVAACSSIEVEIAVALEGSGFARAELDPRGFRSGSLNEPVLITLIAPTVAAQSTPAKS